MSAGDTRCLLRVVDVPYSVAHLALELKTPAVSCYGCDYYRLGAFPGASSHKRIPKRLIIDGGGSMKSYSAFPRDNQR